MSRYAIALFLLLFASAARAGDAGASDQFSAASYSVPVGQALAAQATFPLTGLQWTLANGTQTLSYTVPADLDGGLGTHVVLQGPPASVNGGAVVMSGPLAQGSCLMTSTRLLCMVQYFAGQFEGPDRAGFEANVQNFVGLAHAGAPDLANREAVAEAFGNEPAGIIQGEFSEN